MNAIALHIAPPDVVVSDIAVTDVDAPGRPDAVVIHLSGELDVVSAGTIDVLLSHAATGPTDELIIDLSHVVFIDCAGLRPLLAARDRLPGRMWIQHPSGQVRLLLDVTGLWSGFSVIERSVREVSTYAAERERASRALVVANSATEELELLVAGLHEAMRSRAVIEQAKGLMMGAHGCSANQAFERLTQVSQDHNVRVRDICAGLAAGAAGRRACPPGADVAAALRAVMRVRVGPGQ